MPRRFDLPRPRWIGGWPAATAAIAAHAVLLVLALVIPRTTYEEPVRFIYIGGDPGAVREVPLPPVPAAGDPSGGGPRGVPGPGRPRPVDAPPATPTETPEPSAIAGDTAGGVAVAAGAEGVGGVGAGDSVPATPSPRLGDASLWVRPRRLAEFSLAEQEAILGDPAIGGRIQAIFDSIQAEAGTEQALPRWATEIPGVGPIGIDSGWVTVGPIRIPAAVLALIPFPQGNIEEAERAERLAEMRADLLQAARRAATVAEFKQVVRELRERKERERAFERAQRRRDTIIP